MTPLDAVIERLRGEQLCHRNDLTGCEVWTGDFDRAHKPTATFGTAGKVDVQEYLYQAASGQVVTRGNVVQLRCENSACILPAHMELIAKERKAKAELPILDVEIVSELYFDKGMRIEAILETKEAHEASWTKSYVTKLVAEARSRRSVQA